MRIDFTDTSLDKLRRRDPIFGPVPIADSYSAASVIVRRHGEMQGLCRRLRAEKIWRSRSSPHDLHGLRLFGEGIGYHLIFKHHQSFPQIYARNPVLKPRVKLLPRPLSPCSLIVRTAPVSQPMHEYIASPQSHSGTTGRGSGVSASTQRPREALK
jgi:hypothetical protein